MLESEISATAHVTGYEGITVSEDVLKVYGTALADETALDALILAHAVPEDVLEAVYKCLTMDMTFATKELMNQHLIDNPTHEVQVIYKNKNT